MSHLIKDVERIWDRLFDHKGFLAGEISFLLQEFEQKRNDKEVDNLFRSIEQITEIRDTEINRCAQVAKESLDSISQDLNKVHEISQKFVDLEKKYHEGGSYLEKARNQRKVEWDSFMDHVTTKYAEINSNYESKEQECIKFYENIEKKLLL